MPAVGRPWPSDDDDDDDDGGDGDNDSLRAVTGRKAWVAPVCLSLAPRAQFAPFTEDDQLQVLRKCFNLVL